MKYYVYQLVDPISGVIFYIGKGTGNRWRQNFHRTKRRSRRNAGNFMKDMTMERIRAAGLKPLCRKIGLFQDEAAAYAFEAECIAEERELNEWLTNYNDGIRAELLRARSA